MQSYQPLTIPCNCYANGPVNRNEKSSSSRRNPNLLPERLFRFMSRGKEMTCGLIAEASTILSSYWNDGYWN